MDESTTVYRQKSRSIGIKIALQRVTPRFGSGWSVKSIVLEAGCRKRAVKSELLTAVGRKPLEKAVLRHSSCEILQLRDMAVETGYMGWLAG
ncbi:MAG: hypothetical protein L7T26_03060, partial [Pseudomonadales bacterium]|nr:hypothetical protein [Pseudomonadales bacterium]